MASPRDGLDPELIVSWRQLTRIESIPPSLLLTTSCRYTVAATSKTRWFIDEQKTGQPSHNLCSRVHDGLKTRSDERRTILSRYYKWSIACLAWSLRENLSGTYLLQKAQPAVHLTCLVLAQFRQYCGQFSGSNWTEQIYIKCSNFKFLSPFQRGKSPQ